MWKYNRETSPYLIFCLLIVAFIFLTPNRWFEKREQLATKTSKIIVQVAEMPTGEEAIRQRVRDLSGDANAEIVSMQYKKDAGGIVFYEIDIK